MSQHYSLREVARILGTTRYRVQQLLEHTGISPQQIGSALAMDEEALARIREAHRVVPILTRGRPRNPSKE